MSEETDYTCLRCNSDVALNTFGNGTFETVCECFMCGNTLPQNGIGFWVRKTIAERYRAMLAALEKSVEWLDDACYPDRHPYSETGEEVYEMIQSAIKKARGEQ